MALGRRDAEALEFVRRRKFDGTALVSFELEMQTRRLTLRLYGDVGAPQGDRIASIVFFGVGSLTIQGKMDVADAGDPFGSGFPESATIDTFVAAYDDEPDVGSCVLTGKRDWSLNFNFDGIAYEEVYAHLSSLADD